MANGFDNPPLPAFDTLSLSVPTLRTRRLTLRPHRNDDLPAYAAMWANPIVVRHIGLPQTATEAWLRILRNRGHWITFGFGYWAIEDDAGQFVGEIGFADFMRAFPAGVAERVAHVPEAGWVLGADFHARGFASEATAAIHTWADDHGWPRTFCIINAGNAASLRVAQKLGYREAARYPDRGTDMVVLKRARP